jgi:hypothetical protein
MGPAIGRVVDDANLRRMETRIKVELDVILPK